MQPSGQWVWSEAWGRTVKELVVVINMSVPFQRQIIDRDFAHPAIFFIITCLAVGMENISGSRLTLILGSSISSQSGRGYVFPPEHKNEGVSTLTT